MNDRNLLEMIIRYGIVVLVLFVIALIIELLLVLIFKQTWEWAVTFIILFSELIIFAFIFGGKEV